MQGAFLKKRASIFPYLYQYKDIKIVNHNYCLDSKVPGLFLSFFNFCGNTLTPLSPMELSELLVFYLSTSSLHLLLYFFFIILTISMMYFEICATIQAIFLSLKFTHITWNSSFLIFWPSSWMGYPAGQFRFTHSQENMNLCTAARFYQ